MKYKVSIFLLIILFTAVMTACVAQPATSAYPTALSSEPAATTGAPDITLDDFLPVTGEVLEVGEGYILIEDLIIGGTVKLLLDEDTVYPGKGIPEIKPGWLLSGDTAMGWMKSLPPQAKLRYLGSCVPAVHVEGKVLEVSESSILIEDAEGQQMALLISDGTFFPEGVRGSIKAGGTLKGLRAEEVMESWPVQTRLLAVKSFQ